MQPNGEVFNWVLTMHIIIISTEARLYHVVKYGFDEDVELSSCLHFFGPYRQCLYQ